MKQNKTKILNKWFINYCKKYELDYQKFDFDSEIDSKLSYQENKEQLIRLVKKSIPMKEILEELATKKNCKNQIDVEKKEQQEQFKKEITETEKDFNKAINKIVKDSNPNVDDYFKNAKHYIKMVGEGISNSLILKSDGGLGKTYITLKTLKEMKKDFVYFCAYSTPLSFYEFLYENKDKLIILDDFEGVLNNGVGTAILKSALWSATGKRIIHYLTTSEKLKAPSEFEFKGRLIFCMNNGLNSDVNSRALKTRALFYELNFSYEDTIKILFEIAKQDYKNLEYKERLEVVTYLKRVCDETTIDLNFRTLLKAFDIYIYYKKSKADWKELVRDLIEKNEELGIVKKLMLSDKSVKEQIIEFENVSGKSRRQYFRLKKKLKSAKMTSKRDVGTK